MNTAQTQTARGAVAATGIAPPEEMVRPAVAAGRLVVVIPDVSETAVLASRIQSTAQGSWPDVLLIGVASPFVSADELRRKLTLLAAFLQNAGTKARVRVESNLDGILGLQPPLTDGDLLACCVDTSVPNVGNQFVELLGNRLRRPVYVFMDSGRPRLPRPSLVARLAPWLGSIAVILAFFWLQVRFMQAADSTGWIVISIPVEIGLIWLCNSAFG